MQMKLFNYLKRGMLLLLFSCIAALSFSQTIKGKVFDAKTGEPLVGATVVLKNTRYSTIVNLDGSYTLKNVPAGSYQLDVYLVGYKRVREVAITVDQTGAKPADIGLEPEVTELTAVVVTSSVNKQTDAGVRSIERNADVAENLLSQKTIELLPDVTVATALQRISGVTIQRDYTGEGRYAIIRGMDQRYNNTLVNGIQIPSPDDKYRFVPMDIFPSEMLERLDVIKALTPNMEGDAIGGTMNLVMKNAPDRFLFTVNASGGYNTLFSSQPFTSFDHSGISKQSPAEIYGNNYAASPGDFSNSNLHYSKVSAPVNSTLGFTIGDRFLHKKLGIILSASYQNFYKGSTSDRLVPDAQPSPVPAANTPSFSDSYIRQYSTQTNRIGLQNKIDFVIDDRNKISLFNMYLHQNDYETRYTPDTTVGLNSSASQSQLQVEYRSTWQQQDIYNATLQGIHQISSRVKFDWSGVYSIAEKQLPDQSYYQYDVTVNKDGQGKITSEIPTIATGSNTVNHVWQHNTDQDWAGYANLTYSPTIADRVVEFETGGLYRYKTRNNYYNEYQLQSDVESGTPFTGVDNLPLQFETTGDSKGTTTAINANNYTAHEKIAAGYIQAKFMLAQKLQLLGGVRVENTQQDYTTDMPLTFNAAYGNIHYTDVLPSAHFKYQLTDRQAVRLSYYKSISRPGFGEIDPYIYPGEDFTEIGNPELKHTRADNLDLRYEYFPGFADQILAGVFYKQLQDPIEYFVTRDASPSSLYIKPQNTNQAINFGFEAVYTKFFGKFGVSANYTYTHSAVTTPKAYYAYHYNNSAGDTTAQVNQTRPLQGQANNVGNLSLLYKDPKAGIDVQIAFVYTGDRIAQVSPYYGLDIWQKPFSQLDLSFEKRLTGKFSFYAKINNLTNSINKEYIKAPYSVVNSNFAGTAYNIPFQDAGSNYTVTEKDFYKISFLGGFRYKF